MPRDINLGPTGGPFINLQENNGDLDISNATNVDLNGANLTNANVGGFDSVEVFEADGTFDASNVDTVFVECVGGGGGGGGTVGNNSDTIQLGASGGGGGYTADYLDVSTASSVSVTVGSGGNVLSSGGNSSFGTLLTATGGGGASEDIDGSNAQDGSGGGGDGTFTVPGGDGLVGKQSTDSYSDPITAQTAHGGSSLYGQGAPASFVIDLDLIQGQNGSGYGGGGGGAGALNSTGVSNSLSGGSGAQGVVIVYYKA